MLFGYIAQKIVVDPTPSSSETPSPLKNLSGSFTSLKSTKTLPGFDRKSSSTPLLPTPIAENQHIVADNAHISITELEHSASTNSGRALGHQASNLAIIIPQLPAEARPSEYITLTEDASAISANDYRKHRKNGEYMDYSTPAQSRDQRAIADEASRLLQQLIKDVLESEDELQDVSSRDTPSGVTSYFVSVDNDHAENRALSQATQIKLDLLLQKSIQHGRLCDVPLEHLSKLQSLCDNAISSAELLDLSIDSSWNVDDFVQWSHRLETIDLGLRSARTVLRIMAGGREEKDVYPEELLQKILRLTASTLQSCLIPVVEARGSETTSQLFQSAQPHRKEISQLLYGVGRLMNLLSELLAKVDMAQSIVNAVEFLATNLLFVENPHNEKDSVLGVQKFESLRRTAMDIITIIFSRYLEQRSSIFDEILTSLQKLPTTRQHARQFKLAAGVNVQLVSALIIRLVQTSAKKNILGSPIQRSKMHAITNVSNEHEDGQSDGVGSAPDESSGEDSDDSPKGQCRKILHRLSREVTPLSDSAGKSAQYVIRFFVSRAMTAPKTGDQPHRHLLDIFCEDLIAVLGQPEWPAAELLLRAMLIHMVEIAEKPKFNAPAKNMALELLGLMGSGISNLVAITRQAAKSLENDESEFSGYLRQLLDEYIDGALDNNELLGYRGPYRAVIEYLQSNSADEAQTSSAQAYYIAQWAKAVASGNLEGNAQTEHLAAQLRRSVSSSKWIASEYVDSCEHEDCHPANINEAP